MDIDIEGFQGDINRLFVCSTLHLLPSRAEYMKVSSAESKRLIGVASILSVSDDADDLSLSYEIISRLVECDSDDKERIAQAADIIFSRIGNFPGRELLRRRYKLLENYSPALALLLERLAREVENTIDEGIALTDFQYRFYTSLERQKSLSISAPTSAGKSFVLNLDLIRRLESGREQNIVYIVPTRALISEVSARIRRTIRDRGVAGAVVRSAPFPTKGSEQLKNVIYVLTPERLLSLLKPENNLKKITSIFIDEAHEIQKGNRGITLHGAVDLALDLHQDASILFASPLIKNPGYFLSLFGRQGEGVFFTETISPVSQNILLISEVNKQPSKVDVSLLAANRIIDLGVTEVDFKFRGAKSAQRARFASEITLDNESTIIFANGPGEAESVAEELIRINRGFVESEEVRDFVNFIRAEVHDEYPLANTLRYGVAVHYGDMPSIVRSGVEELFKSGEIRFLCCTSTLLQGVNLPAKHIVIENPYSGDKPMSRSDFLNLSGRAGRLLQEFHGNIWCIRPGDWSEESYAGDKLQEIKSSMSKVMNDGGKIIEELLSGADVDENRNLAEAGFSRLYQETRNLGEEEVILKYGTQENSETLARNLERMRRLSITLPQEILDSHSSLRPDHLQDLYDKLHGMIYTDEFSLINPFQKGGYERMKDAINIISGVFGWAENQKFRNAVTYTAHQWVTGAAISTLIRDRVNHVKRENESANTSAVIRQLLKLIETEIRFKLVKYFSAFEDIIKHCLMDKGANEYDSRQAPYHTFLEFGSCSPIELSLMSLGFSRFTALRLRHAINWGDAQEIEDYLYFLARVDLSILKMPKVCLKEINDILGQQ
ncbi:Helicase conserved C-terminal domain-containing protein [Pseudomonas asplenii]|uniref:Helicase conserved C-terminal domain-containing protein n=1 Tax=Pseudomonas asplenii TaxID=53407 RepID=A0A1H6PAM1_9PSED|nr:DEAD/DEAH box helicase [Pseudomonas fuscovaginae]SEI21785.1 Helicase conserved C-terminal domain-containing protein [Pseudomonas fuscovaginae]